MVLMVWLRADDPTQNGLIGLMDIATAEGLVYVYISEPSGGHGRDEFLHTYFSGPCCQTIITCYPYAEGFETGLGDWVNAAGDDFDWDRWSGATPSNGTGPSSASEGAYYLYTEASPNNPTKTAILEGPCFDFSLRNSPALKFQYHMYGSSMGTLRVEVSNDDCQNWTTVWSLAGDQGNAWYEATVDLSAYGGYNGRITKIRFRGVTGSGFTSDMAIDDVRVDACCAKSDLDCDGDVDNQDFLVFSRCYNGSLNPLRLVCANPNADIDGDGDADNQDFLTFSRCYNGSLNVPRCPGPWPDQ